MTQLSLSDDREMKHTSLRIKVAAGSQLIETLRVLVIRRYDKLTVGSS
jgi:hypothetical protein